MTNFKITKRKLTKSEIETFASELKNTPNIIGYTKKEWQKFKDVWVAEADGKTVGVVVNTDLLDAWSETNILYVLEKYRGQGIGKALFCEAIKSMQNSRRNVYYVSRNPIVIKWMKEEKMVIDNIHRLPLPLRLRIVKKALNFYRIKEFVRKLFVFPHQPKFLQGYKISR